MTRSRKCKTNAFLLFQVLELIGEVTPSNLNSEALISHFLLFNFENSKWEAQSVTLKRDFVVDPPHLTPSHCCVAKCRCEKREGTVLSLISISHLSAFVIRIGTRGQQRRQLGVHARPIYTLIHPSCCIVCLCCE